MVIEREAYEETVRKVLRCDEDATVVTLDQPRKAIGADRDSAWGRDDERSPVEVSASRGGVNLLGAVTESGE
jgi:hypothetical protein